MADAFLDSITEQLPQLDVSQLGELMDKFQIPIVAAKKGKKGAMISAVVKHINRAELEGEADQGEEELGRLDGELAKLLKKKVAVSSANNDAGGGDSSGTAVKVEDSETVTEVKPVVKEKTSGGDGGNNTGGGSNSGGGNGGGDVKMQFLKGLKLREFKLSGAVGTEENCIDYQQLTYQMQQGREDGYSFKEVMFGVIKAIKNPNMKKFFQGKAFSKSGGNTLTEEKFHQMLRSKYMVKDAEAYYNKMAEAKQGEHDPKETEMDFLYRVLHLRDTFVELS